MKKLLALLLLITLSVTALASCNLVPNSDKNDAPTVIRVGFMEGPTGMGMAKLIHDNGGLNGNNKYKFTKFKRACL